MILICHCSYRGVIELLRDLFDYSLSVGTIHNRVMEAVQKARNINQSQDLSPIKVPLLDEIFQGNQPVLTGVDSDSTYCFLLEAVSHRDENTWGWYLLEAESQGLNPDYTIADAGVGIRAGQKTAFLFNSEFCTLHSELRKMCGIFLTKEKPYAVIWQKKLKELETLNYFSQSCQKYYILSG